MTGEKTVSIVVPTRNCKTTVHALLSSLQKLDYPSYEVIVVDSSDDGTDKVMSKFNVKIIRMLPNGPNAARNLGVHASSGDIICFTDGDCIVPHDWIKRIICEFKKNTKIGCVGGSVLPSSCTFFGRYSTETLVSIFPKYTKSCMITKSQLSNQPFTRERFPVSCNLAFKRKVWEELGGFNEKFWGGWEEFEFLYRMLDYGYLIVVNPEIVVYHHPRSSLLKMIRQAYGYGVGAGRFSKVFHVPMLKNKIKHAMEGLYLTLPHSLRLFQEKRRLSVLLYPFVDVLVGSSYYLGLLKALGESQANN